MFPAPVFSKKLSEISHTDILTELPAQSSISQKGSLRDLCIFTIKSANASCLMLAALNLGST